MNYGKKKLVIEKDNYVCNLSLKAAVLGGYCSRGGGFSLFRFRWCQHGRDEVRKESSPARDYSVSLCESAAGGASSLIGKSVSGEESCSGTETPPCRGPSLAASEDSTLICCHCRQITTSATCLRDGERRVVAEILHASKSERWMEGVGVHKFRFMRESKINPPSASVAFVHFFF